MFRTQNDMAWPAQHIHTYGRFDKEKGKTETKPDRRPETKTLGKTYKKTHCGDARLCLCCWCVCVGASSWLCWEYVQRAYDAGIITQQHNKHTHTLTNKKKNTRWYERQQHSTTQHQTQNLRVKLREIQSIIQSLSIMQSRDEEENNNNNIKKDIRWKWWKRIRK